MMKKLIYTVILLLFSYVSFSQEMNNTLYFLRYSPQANSLNPAITLEAKVWVGFPALSSIGLQYNNNSFNLEDIIIKKKNYTGDKPYMISIDNLYDNLSNNTTINMNTDITLMSIGIRAKRDVYTLEMKHKNTFSMGFDKSLVGFFKEGTAAYKGETIQFGDTQFNGLAYNEIAIGYSRELDKEKKFIVGAKLKLIMGIASMDMSDSNLSLDIAKDGLSANVRSKMDVRVAGPILFKNPNAEEFKIDDVDYDDSDVAGTALGSNNLGFGIDLGVQYRLLENVTLYASVLDLGFINWKEGHNVFMNADYDWDGIDFTNQIKDDSFDAMEEFSDELEKEFVLTKKDEGFIQALPAKLFIGGQYKVKEWFTAGLLSRTQFYNGRVYSSLTASGNIAATRRLSASLSYSVLNNSYTNVGLGVTAQLGPLQLYMVTDNIFAANLATTQLVNARFGMNIRVGLKKKRKLEELELVE